MEHRLCQSRPHPNITFKTFSSPQLPSEKMQIVMNSPRQDIFDPDRFTAERIETGDAGSFGSCITAPSSTGTASICWSKRWPTPAPDSRYPAGHLWHQDPVSRHGPGDGEAFGRGGYRPVSRSQEPTRDRRRHPGVPRGRGAQPSLRVYRHQFPTRIFEYLAMHRPVIAPTPRDQRLFPGRPDAAVRAEQCGRPRRQNSLVREQPKAAEAIVVRGTQVYRENLWSVRKRVSSATWPDW